MLAKEMRVGEKYKLANGDVVECRRMGASGQWVIVTAPGEPDMQSCFGIPLTEEVTAFEEGRMGRGNRDGMEVAATSCFGCLFWILLVAGAGLSVKLFVWIVSA